MPKKSAPVKTSQPAERRQYIAEIDPLTLFGLLEHHFDDADSSPYRRLYSETRADVLQVQEAVEFAALLDNVDEANGVEVATRAAGFVLGFETCRQLILGELDLEALKGGAR